MTRTRVGAVFATLAFLGVSVVVWGGRGPTAIDIAWTELLRGIQSPQFVFAAKIFDVVGNTFTSGILVVLLAAVFIFLHRRWSALFLVAASSVSALMVQGVKVLFARPRPEDMIVTSDFGSFPSGHSANAAVLMIVLALLFPRARWLPYASGTYVLLMVLSRTYLRAHWITDTIAGVLLGVTITILIWTFMREKILQESG